MGPGKGSTRGGAFFNLFDWNRRSRRKLFANETASQVDETKHASRRDVFLPETGLHPSGEGGDVDAGGAAGVNGGSGDVIVNTADDGAGVKVPGVVARLMGLDFLPVTSMDGASCWQDCCCQEQSLEDVSSELVDGMSCGNELCSCKLPDRLHRQVPDRPVKRFQTEVFLPKSRKSLPTARCKLLSQTRNHHYISSDNATHIMEAAAKILEPRSQGNSSTGFQSSELLQRPLRVCDKPECTAAPRRSSGFPKTPVIESDGVNQLGSKRFSHNWNDSEVESRFKSSLRSSSSVNSKGKGNSTSLSGQCKTDVLIKEFSGADNDIVCNQPSKTQMNSRKNSMDRKGSSSNSSSVLKQNNLKQNSLGNKDILADRIGGSISSRGKSIPRDGIFIKNKTTNKVPVVSMTGSSKQGQIVYGSVKRVSTPQTISYIRQTKRRNVENQMDNNLTDNIVVSRIDKCLQQSLVADKKPMQNEQRRRNSMEVVSFTFTSPICKPAPATLSLAGRMEKQEDNRCSSGTGSQEGHIMDLEKRGSPSVEKVITGDALSRLLEQKLRELTSELELPESNSVQTGVRSIHQDALYVPETKVMAIDEDCYGPFSNWGASSVSLSKWSPDQDSKEAQSIMESSTHDSGELDPLLSSPPPIPNPFFSNESEDDIGCSTINHQALQELDINYVREILSASQLHDGDVMLGCDPTRNVDPLNLAQPEDRTTNFNYSDEKDARFNTKLLFDCIAEGLDAISTSYFRSGFRSWAIGMMLLQGGLAEKIYKEILSWRSFTELMLDELVDGDMSSHLGRWVDFETDAFWVGSKIEEELLCSLIDELVVELPV